MKEHHLLILNNSLSNMIQFMKEIEAEIEAGNEYNLSFEEKAFFDV